MQQHRWGGQLLSLYKHDESKQRNLLLFMTTTKAGILTFSTYIALHNDDTITCPFAAIQYQQRRKQKKHERMNGN